MNPATPATIHDDDLYPLEGVQMPTTPASECPLDDDPGRAAQLERDRYYVEHGVEVDADHDTDTEQTLLRMLRNCIEDSDARTSDLGVHGGEKGYWEGKAEATELAHQGWSIDRIADAIGVPPERIARLFTNDTTRVTTYLNVDRLVRSDEWDGQIDSVQNVAPDVPRPTVKQMLLRLGVQTKAAKQVRTGGGYKYTAEQYESIRRMRLDFGWSWKQIEKQTGIKDSTAIKIAQRKGWV